MNRGDAYAVLAVSGIGKTTSRIQRVGQEEIVIETTVMWDDEATGVIRVTSTALGPSWWTVERLEESVLILPQEARKEK